MTLRSWVDGWTTSACKHAAPYVACRFGCACIEARDDFAHYLVCPLLLDALVRAHDFVEVVGCSAIFGILPANAFLAAVAARTYITFVRIADESHSRVACLRAIAADCVADLRTHRADGRRER